MAVSPLKPMTALSIEVQDISRLVVPSPRRIPTAKEMAAFVSRLAPIEMATASIHLQTPLPLRGKPLPPLPEPDPPPVPPGRQHAVPGWLLPVCYVSCGLALSLCNVLVPEGVVNCAHILTPLWTLALGLHALAYGEPSWMWLGGLVTLLLPFVLLLRDLLFAGFYLLAFTVFGSGRFWQNLHGSAFVLVCVCWFGVGTSLAFACVSEYPRAQICVAVFFALALATVVSWTRFSKLRLALV